MSETHSSQERPNPEAIKYEVTLRRRRQAAKTVAFVQLFAMGVVAAFAWKLDLGYWVVDAVGLVPPSGEMKLIHVEVLGSLLVSGLVPVVGYPGFWALREMMVAPPGEHEAGSDDATLRKRMSRIAGVLAVLAVVGGVAVTMSVATATFSTEALSMAVSICAALAWLLLGACFLQVHRALKR